MDEYVGKITQVHFGRVRHVVYALQFSRTLLNGCEKKYALQFAFIRACNNADFRNYYFRPGRVSLKYLEDIKFVILFANPDVFRYTIRVFRREFRNIFLTLHFKNCNPVFYMKRTVKRNNGSYVTKLFVKDERVQKYNVKNQDLMEMMRERGFKIYTGNGDMGKYAILKIHPAIQLP